MHKHLVAANDGDRVSSVAIPIADDNAIICVTVGELELSHTGPAVGAQELIPAVNHRGIRTVTVPVTEDHFVGPVTVVDHAIRGGLAPLIHVEETALIHRCHRLRIGGRFAGRFGRRLIGRLGSRLRRDEQIGNRRRLGIYPKRVEHGVVQIGLVSTANNVLRTRARSRHAELGSGVALIVAIGLRIVDHRVVVGEGHRIPIRGEQRGGKASGIRANRGDLRGVGVIGGDHNQGRLTGLLHPGLRGLHCLIQIIEFADLATSVAVVISLINRGALNLEEEAVLVGEEVHGLGRHRREARDFGRASGVQLASGRGIGLVAVLGRNGLKGVTRHIARREQTNQRGMLVSGGHRGQLIRRRHNLEAVVLRVFEHRLAGLPLGGTGPHTGNLNFGVEILGAATEQNIEARIDQLLGNRTASAVLASVGGFNDLLGPGGSIGGALGHVRANGSRGGVLYLSGGDVTDL